MLGLAFLAYTFGLRHAVDADHIAAIDNVVRKLMHAGRSSQFVGFYFSLGHSAVVGLASVGVTMAASSFQSQLAEFKAIGSIVGAAVSSFFLLIVAFINFIILLQIWRSFRSLRAGKELKPEYIESLTEGGGVLARSLRGLFRMITRSWHMFPLGFVFGLGFDTATEIGLLGISATQAAQGLSPWSILIFPALFTAGMTLVDAADGMFMARVYGWAFATPVRKLWYNLAITALSALVAFIIGGIEALNLLAISSIGRDIFGLRSMTSMNRWVMQD
jgi:high-affinity nickel-transport protein